MFLQIKLNKKKSNGNKLRSVASPCLLGECCPSILYGRPSFMFCYSAHTHFANESGTISGYSFMKGTSQAFHYGPAFYVGIRLMEPRASIHRNNKLKVILFVLPWFLLIIWLFCDSPYGVLCFKTSFGCRRLLLCYVCIWKRFYFIL